MKISQIFVEQNNTSYFEQFGLCRVKDSHHPFAVRPLDLVQQRIELCHPLLPVVQLGFGTNVVGFFAHLLAFCKYLRVWRIK